VDMDFGKACVLLVAGSETDRGLISAFLENYGIEVATTYDMSTAPDILKSMEVDLIIWTSAGEAPPAGPASGFTSGPGNHGVPVMAIGPVSREDGEFCDLVLEKPVSRENFFNSLKILLKPARIEPDEIMDQKSGIPGSPVSPETADRMRQLQVRLLDIEKTVWADLKQAMVIDDILVFAESLMALAKEFDYPYLHHYAEGLARQAKKFDMVQLPAGLDHYSGLIRRISALIGEPAVRS